MAMNYGEAAGMNAAARESGKTLGIAYYRRMYPKLQRARHLLAEGAIGRPVLAEINAHDWFTAEDGHRAWLLDPAQAGGGPLYDIASHRIDALNFLFGKPVRVSGHLSTLVHDWCVEDSATILIDYENGVRGVVDVRWHSRITARRVPHHRGRWRNVADAAQRSGAELQRKDGGSAAARQPALSLR